MYHLPPNAPVEPRLDEGSAVREDDHREKGDSVGHIEVRLRRRRNGREHADEDELTRELEELEPAHIRVATHSQRNSIAQAFKH